MKALKIIHTIVSAIPVNLRDISMKQPLPVDGIQQIDPFLLIQHGAGVVEAGTKHRNAGVGPHPHRGFSPVTFIYKGSIHH